MKLRRYSLIVIIKPGHVTYGQSFVLPIMLQILMMPPIGLVRYLHEFEILPVVHCPGRLHQVAWGSGALEKEKKAPVIAVLKSVLAIIFKVTYIVMRYSSIGVFGDRYFKEVAGVIHGHP